MKEKRESEQDEQLPEVRSRLMQALKSIAESHNNKHSLVCTHGGCLWAVISHFDKNFDYEDYKKLGTPDVRRIIFKEGTPILDSKFVFHLP